MDTTVFLITISASTLVARYKDRLRHLVGWNLPHADEARPDPSHDETSSVLIDRTLGLARLELPDGWRGAHDLNETASIEAIHAQFGRHLIVISDAVEDFVPEMTVYEHSVNTRAELTGSIRVIACSGPERRTVGGFDAVQYEIEGFFQQTRVKYLHTTVAGRRAFHQVLAWAPYTRYDRASFERVLNGFSELPNLQAAAQLVVSLPQPLHVVPVSQYDVH